MNKVKRTMGQRNYRQNMKVEEERKEKERNEKNGKERKET